MRVLVTFEYPFAAHGYGGGNQATRGIARAFARLGHESHILCAGRDELGVADQDAEVTYHFTGTYAPNTTGIRTSLAALKLMRRLRPNLLICMTSEAALLLPFRNLLGARGVVYIGTPKLAPFRKLTKQWLRHVRFGLGSFLQFIGALTAYRVLTVSYSLSIEAQGQWGLRPDRVTCVGLGLDESILATPPRPPAEFSGTGPKLLSVGRIVHAQKPLDVMASALASVRRPWSSWTIIGSGADEAALRAKVAALGIENRVVFRGTLLSEQVRRELDEAHIVLLPSRYEGYFTTVYEAVSRGRVVVTNDVNDVTRSFGAVESVLVADRAESESYQAMVERAIDGYSALAQRALEASARVRATETWDMVAQRVLAAADLEDLG